MTGYLGEPESCSAASTGTKCDTYTQALLMQGSARGSTQLTCVQFTEVASLCLAARRHSNKINNLQKKQLVNGGTGFCFAAYLSRYLFTEESVT